MVTTDMEIQCPNFTWPQLCRPDTKHVWCRHDLRSHCTLDYLTNCVVNNIYDECYLRQSIIYCVILLLCDCESLCESLHQVSTRSAHYYWWPWGWPQSVPDTAHCSFTVHNQTLSVLFVFIFAWRTVLHHFDTYLQKLLVEKYFL